MLGVIFWTGLLPAAGMALTAGAGMPAGPGAWACEGMRMGVLGLMTRSV